jgi:arginyl-tRNA--protein-N-Asp/Glu arginylyltransferase
MNHDVNDDGLRFRDDFPCPYFDDTRTASVEYVFPDKKQTKAFHNFLAAGYRRYGCVFYRNVCTQCAACRPIRIETENFIPSRSQKRTLRRNSDVRIEHIAPLITTKKVELYRKYLISKHQEKEIRDFEGALANLHYGYSGTIEMNYYLGEKLIAVGIVDASADSLSSNYFYYDTDHPERRLGVFSLLTEIFLARAMGKKYHYLGFCIEETQKMAYKKFFRPNQILDSDKWKDFLK